MRFQQVYDWIEENKPEVICEVGTWNGKNAVRMLKEGAKRYVGFDIWEEGNEVLDELENNAKGRVAIEQARETLKDFEAELICGNTRDTLPEYAKGKEPFIDMALIDGGHSKGTIKSDLTHLIPLMKSSGVIFLDDFYFGNVVDGQGKALPNMGAQTVLAEFQIPFTVLAKVDKAAMGYFIRMVRIDVKHIPRPQVWKAPSSTWQFNPEAA